VLDALRLDSAKPGFSCPFPDCRYATHKSAYLDKHLWFKHKTTKYQGHLDPRNLGNDLKLPVSSQSTLLEPSCNSAFSNLSQRNVPSKIAEMPTAHSPAEVYSMTRGTMFEKNITN
jgi:hypothetical protein